MTSGNRPTLKLVPYDPNDYGLGDVITKSGGTTLDQPRDLNAVLSLFFQWPEYRNAFIANNTGARAACDIDYDQDERSPSELWIRTKDTSSSGTPEVFSTIKLCIEIFGATYEWQAPVIAVTRSEVADEATLIIVDIPLQMTVVRRRGLPRRYVDDISGTPFEGILWRADKSDSVIPLLVKELGLLALVAAVPTDLAGPGLIVFKDGFCIPGHILRMNQKRAIITLRHENDKTYGQYFDRYRTIAYPDLRSRHEYPYETGVKLYEETGYFDKFSKENKDNASKELPGVWAGIKSGEHETTADYYVVDEENKPVGFSSCVKAFIHQGKDIWMFSQLCAKKEPRYIMHTAQLYLWRVEYLLGRADDGLSVGGTYDSNGRLIERIFTKYARQGHEDDLKSIRYYKIQVDAPNKLVNRNHYNIGKYIRHYFDDVDRFGAAGPPLLNAGGNLNVIDYSNSGFDHIVFQSDIKSLLTNEPMSMRIITDENSIAPASAEIQQTNRFCRINKVCLFDLLFSIQHSFAVLKKKVNH